MVHILPTEIAEFTDRSIGNIFVNFCGSKFPQELLTEALAAEWTAEQAAVLERTEGAESVVDAVQRVASNSPLVRTVLDSTEFKFMFEFGMSVKGGPHICSSGSASRCRHSTL